MYLSFLKLLVDLLEVEPGEEVGGAVVLHRLALGRQHVGQVEVGVWHKDKPAREQG